MSLNQNNQSINFNAICGFCGNYPLNQVLYYCEKCNTILCSSCEKQIGIFHDHPYLEIRNQSQFYFLNIGKKRISEEIINDFGKVVDKTFESVLGFMSINNDNINNYNNINDSNVSNNKQVSQSQMLFSLIEKARSKYELSNVSDKQIEEALKKCGNNIDDADIFLFS